MSDENKEQEVEKCMYCGLSDNLCECMWRPEWHIDGTPLNREAEIRDYNEFLRSEYPSRREVHEDSRYYDDYKERND